jgi:uncharacterized SAM-binding protein YcdF (DUF218 family)
MTGRERGRAALEGGVTLALAWVALAELSVGSVLGLAGLDVLLPVLLVGALAGALGAGRWLRQIAVGALGLLVVASLGFGLPRLVAGLVQEDVLPVDPSDAVFVLAGSVSTDARIGPQATDRLLEGIRLVRSGAAPRLVVSRVGTRLGRDSIFSDADASYLLQTAGLQTELHVLFPVGSTRAEAERLAELAARHQWRRVVVVSSPLHTRRACGAVARVGLEVVCRPSPDRSIAWRTLPRPSDRIAALAGWLYESLGWLEYRVRGWV